MIDEIRWVLQDVPLWYVALAGFVVVGGIGLLVWEIRRGRI